MADQQNPSPSIAGVIDTLSQAGGEPQETRKRTYTKRRRRKNARKNATTRDALQLNVPSSDEEPRSRMFLTTVANLALLVAVLTIVFAAHRAVQNNRQQTAEQTTDHRPQTIDQTTQTTEPASEPRTTAEQIIDDRPETIDQKQQAQPQPRAGPPPAETEPAKQAKRAKLAQPSSDPYTNGGALDLDRMLPSARSNTGSDHNNPWNSGGNLDLDSETNRQQYKKALSLAE